MIGTTKLEAINTMLSTIGEASTNTLTGTLPFEVSLAEDILDEVIRETLQDAYVFNFEEDITISPNINDNLVAQTHWIRIQNTDTSEEYVLRESSAGSGTYVLYSMNDKTKIFTSSVTVDVVYLLDFMDLPEAAKRYCTVRAARIYADRLVGSKDIRAFTLVDELEAKAKLANYQSAVDMTNMLRDNASTSAIINRRIR